MHVFGGTLGQLGAQFAGLDDRLLEIRRDLLDPRLLLGNDVVAPLETHRGLLEGLLHLFEIGPVFFRSALRDAQLGFEFANPTVTGIAAAGTASRPEARDDRRQQPAQQKSPGRVEDQLLREFDKHRLMINRNPVPK